MNSHRGPAATSDKDLDAFVRAKAESAYHPSSTCKMGQDDWAVVDPEGRVHGAERLRVIDASVMPSIVSGNLNAAVIMMAEKLADKIRGKTPLEPSDAPYFLAESWMQEQR